MFYMKITGIENGEGVNMKNHMKILRKKHVNGSGVMKQCVKKLESK